MPEVQEVWDMSQLNHFQPVCGPGALIGLSQTWPLFGQISFVDNDGSVTPFGGMFPPSKVSSIPPVSSGDKADGNYDEVGNLVEYDSEGIPVVSFPKLLAVEGKTKRQLERAIQRFCDRLVLKPPQQVAAELTSQIFLDNDELLYVLVTDVASYPVMSKSLNWMEYDHERVAGNTVAFTCLFDVANETFALFLFSPMDIIFILEGENNQQEGEYPCWNGPITSVFFFGSNKVGISFKDDKKIITIQFLYEEEAVEQEAAVMGEFGENIETLDAFETEEVDDMSAKFSAG